jgi:hypothetical protein
MSNSTKNLRLPRQAIKEDGLVILPLKEYEKMRRKMAKLIEGEKALVEETKVLKIVAEGEREYRGGKLRPISSLAELG